MFKCGNLKVLPVSILDYHNCCICFDRKRKNNLIKCENKSCVDGYVCKDCRESSNNTLNKCPLCRCDSKNFIIQIKDIPFPVVNVDIENDEDRKSISYYIITFFKDKNIIRNTIFFLIFIFMCLVLGLVVFLLFGGNIEETNIGTIFIIGLITLLVLYLICGFFCKDIDK